VLLFQIEKAIIEFPSSKTTCVTPYCQWNLPNGKNTYLIDDGEGNKKFYGLSSWPNYVSLQKALKSFCHMISEFGFVKE